MTMKLVQKRFLQGTREFQITGDAVYVRKKGLLKEERLTVSLSKLNPEPVMKGTELEFHSLAKGETLLSLFLNMPSTGEFNAFIDTLKQQIQSNDNAYAGLQDVHPVSPPQEARDWNVYDEPPEFAEPTAKREKVSFRPVNPARVEEDIAMLKTYVQEAEVKPLIEALEELMEEPENEAVQQKIVDIFNGLGFYQGAVLTYAHYLKVLLSESIL